MIDTLGHVHVVAHIVMHTLVDGRAHVVHKLDHVHIDVLDDRALLFVLMMTIVLMLLIIAMPMLFMFVVIMW